MRAAQTVHVLVEIHHLKTIELVRHVLDLFLLAGLDGFDAWSVPFDVYPRGFLILSAGFDGATGNLAIVDVLNSVVPHGACFDPCPVHLESGYCCFSSLTLRPRGAPIAFNTSHPAPLASISPSQSSHKR